MNLQVLGTHTLKDLVNLIDKAIVKYGPMTKYALSSIVTNLSGSPVGSFSIQRSISSNSRFVSINSDDNTELVALANPEAQVPFIPSFETHDEYIQEFYKLYVEYETLAGRDHNLPLPYLLLEHHFNKISEEDVPWTGDSEEEEEELEQEENIKAELVHDLVKEHGTMTPQALVFFINASDKISYRVEDVVGAVIANDGNLLYKSDGSRMGMGTNLVMLSEHRPTGVSSKFPSYKDYVIPFNALYLKHEFLKNNPELVGFPDSWIARIQKGQNG